MNKYQKAYEAMKACYSDLMKLDYGGKKEIDKLTKKEILGASRLIEICNQFSKEFGNASENPYNKD